MSNNGPARAAIPPIFLVFSQFYRWAKWSFIAACSFIFRHIINRPMGGIIARKLFRMASGLFVFIWGQASNEGGWFANWLQDRLGRDVHNVAEEHAAQWGRENADLIGGSLVFAVLTTGFALIEWLVPKLCAAVWQKCKNGWEYLKNKLTRRAQINVGNNQEARVSSLPAESKKENKLLETSVPPISVSAEPRETEPASMSEGERRLAEWREKAAERLLGYQSSSGLPEEGPPPTYFPQYGANTSSNTSARSMLEMYYTDPRLNPQFRHKGNSVSPEGSSLHPQ